MDKIIYYGVLLIVSVIAFVVGKYIFPKIPKEALYVLSEWAGKFVIWAKEFMDGETGEAKMQAVVSQLKEIADDRGIPVTEEQLQALTQAAYESFVKGEGSV